MKNLIVLALFVVSMPVIAGVLIEHDGIKVTDKDVVNYFKDRVPAESLSRAVGDQNKYIEVIENIYVIRALARRAKTELKEADLANWVADLEKDRVLMQALLKQSVNDKTSSVNWEQYAREEYIANPGLYNSPAKVSASHILISRDGRSQEQMVLRAQEIAQKLGGESSFAEIALEFSDDSSAKTNSGYLGEFSRNEMVKPFSDAAFSMSKKGQVSEPVETQFGLHLIQFHSRTEPQKLPFDSVKNVIIKRGKEREANNLHKRMVIEVKSSSRSDVLKTDLDKLEHLVRDELGIPESETPSIQELLRQRGK